MVPPTDSMAREMSTALRRGVPLKSMCSMKCATPLSAGVSAREPTGTQIPTVADRSQGTCSETMATPLSRRVRATVIAVGLTASPSPAAAAVPPAIPARVALLLVPVLSLRRARGLGEPALLLELLVGETDLPVPVHLEDADGDVVVLLEAVGDVDPVLRDLGNVEQAVGAREDFHECAEIHDLAHSSLVDLPNLGALRDPLDDGDGRPRRIGVHRGDLHGAVVVDVDLHARLLLDPADDLSSRADDLPDLVGLHHHHVDPRCVRGEVGAVGVDHGVHLLQDVETTLAGL